MRLPLSLACALATASALADVRVLALPDGASVPLGRFWQPNVGVMLDGVSGEARWTSAEKRLQVRLRRLLKLGETLRSGGSSANPSSIFGVSETVELFVAPHAERADAYYQIAVNPSNVVYFASGEDATWRPAKPIDVNSTVAESVWACSFDIPFGAFGEAAVCSGCVWRVEFAAGDGSWCGTTECHDTRTYGSLCFGGTAPRTTVENVTHDADGTVRLSLSIRPEPPAFELPHKGVTLDALRLEGRTGTLAEIPFVVPPGDGRLLELDRFYYPAGDVKPKWSSSRFLTARTAFARADGTVVAGADDVGEYSFTVENEEHRAACCFETVDGGNALANPVPGTLRVVGRHLAGDFSDGKGRPFFPIIGSQDLSGTMNVRVCPPARANQVVPVVSTRGFELVRMVYEAEDFVPPKADGCVTPPRAVDYLRDAYRTLRSRNPAAIVSVHTDCRHDVAAFADVCDVFETAYYSCSYSANPLLTIDAALTRAISCGRGKPVVFWVGTAVPRNGSCRTADELNTVVRYCVLRGVAGVVFHLGHGGIPRERTRLWNFMRNVENETAKWYPGWIGGKVEILPVDSPPDVRVAVRRTAGGRIVLAANLSPDRRCFTVRFSNSDKRQYVLTGFGSLALQVRASGTGER